MYKFNSSGLQQINVIDHDTCFEIVEGRWAGSYIKHIDDTLLRAVTSWIIESGLGRSVISIDINGLCTYSETICAPITQSVTSTHVFDSTTYTRRVFTNGVVNWSSNGIGHGEDIRLDRLYLGV